ncbi:MAG: hypothetical protein JXR94_06495 [Candidatus Hydrogenedentes bacterium]|nr:hypothetical protein [Candidatus Hydrogenedentota bacterium]
MDNGLALADYLIVAGFFVIMLVIGLYFSGKMKSLKDFFGAGSQVPWWVSSVSLYMSTFSAFAFVSYSALAYNDGMVAIVIWWTGVPCWILSAYFLAARWRRAASTSPLEFIEQRYGSFLRQGFAWAGVPLIVIDDALKLYVIGKMVTVSLGTTDTSALLIAIAVCGSIMLTYTFLGGLWAVMITDFIQFVVMATAVLVLIPLVLGELGGIGHLFAGAPEGFWAPTSKDFSCAWLIGFLPIQFFSYSTRWSLVQRYYAVKTDRDARKVGYLVAALTFFGVPFLFFPAMAARIFMPGVEDGNSVYPLLCKQLLPVGMMGMMIAAMFSATMSMLSSDYNAVASVMTNDIYKRLFGKAKSERSLVIVGRISTLIIGVLALGVGLLLGNAGEEPNLVKIMASLFGVLLPPFAVPMICGLLTRRVSNAGAISGFLAGAACGLAAYALSYIDGLVILRSARCLPWISSIPAFGLMALVSALVPDWPDKRQAVARFLDGLGAAALPRAEERSEDPGAGPGSGLAVSALQIIGVATSAIGLLLAGSVLTTGRAADGVLSIGVGVVMLAGGLAMWGGGKALAGQASRRTGASQ